MDDANRLITELSELSGQELAFAEDMCDIDVEGHALLLRYQAEAQVWVVLGVVAHLNECESPDQRNKLMAAALRANFLGRGTGEFCLGLFADALMLHDRIPAQNLEVTAFAERIVALARQISSLEKSLLDTPSDEGIDGRNSEELLRFSSLGV